MPFCRNCGSEIPGEAAFCPSCGTSVTSLSAYVPLPTSRTENEFDRLTRDSATQEFWLKRLIAYIIDWIIIEVAVAIISVIIFIAFGLGDFIAAFLGSGFALNPFVPGALFSSGLSAILFLLYFTLLDYRYGKTPGKSLMGFRVVTTDGTPLDLSKSFIRNVSKIYWLLLLLDIIFGLVSRVEPGQKYSDYFAKTNVQASTAHVR